MTDSKKQQNQLVFTRVLKPSPKNNSKTNEEEILREKYISPELRLKIIDVLKLKIDNYWWSKINTIII